MKKAVSSSKKKAKSRREQDEDDDALLAAYREKEDAKAKDSQIGDHEPLLNVRKHVDDPLTLACMENDILVRTSTYCPADTVTVAERLVRRKPPKNLQRFSAVSKSSSGWIIPTGIGLLSG